MLKAYISGTGSYAPPKIIPNQFFDAVGSSDEWIYNTLGIRERRIAEGETTSDLAAKAGLKAIEDAGLEVKDIDLIIVATATPDRIAPSCACFVQEKMQAPNAVAFDISAVCSGALFATSIGVQFVETGMYKHVLVIGADTFSTIIDWERRDAVFFGDGAGAIVLSQTTEDKGFVKFILHADGSGKEHFTVPAGGSEMPASAETVAARQHYFQMNGKAVYSTATQVVPENIKELLEYTDTAIEDIKYMIPHQPQYRYFKRDCPKN
jgi:3-oxoacyl-[acyl-carrier-protein] synthase-3